MAWELVLDEPTAEVYSEPDPGYGEPGGLIGPPLPPEPTPTGGGNEFGEPGPAPSGYTWVWDGYQYQLVRLPSGTGGSTARSPEQLMGGDPNSYDYTIPGYIGIPTNYGGFEYLRLQDTGLSIADQEALLFEQQKLAQQQQQFNQNLGFQGQQLEVDAALGYAESERADAQRRLSDFMGRVQLAQTLGYYTTPYGEQIMTLEREALIAQSELANLTLQAQFAVDAGRLALQRGDQVEAQRQFDLSYQLQQQRLSFETQVATNRNQLDQSYYKLATEQFGVDREVALRTLAMQEQGQTFSQEFQTLKFQADDALNKAYLALAQGNQAEAQRQFDLSYQLQQQAQTFGQGLQTQQFGLEQELGRRSMTLQEQQAAFGQNLATAQFNRDVMADPASWLYKAYAGRGLEAPSISPTTPLTGSLLGGQQVKPLGLSEVQRAGLLPGLESAFGGSTGDRLPTISAQDYGALTPLERQGFESLITATGRAPEDYFQQASALSQTTKAPVVQKAPLSVFRGISPGL